MRALLFLIMNSKHGSSAREAQTSWEELSRFQKFPQRRSNFLLMTLLFASAVEYANYPLLQARSGELLRAALVFSHVQCMPVEASVGYRRTYHSSRV